MTMTMTIFYSWIFPTFLMINIQEDLRNIKSIKFGLTMIDYSTT